MANKRVQLSDTVLRWKASAKLQKNWQRFLTLRNLTRFVLWDAEMLPVLSGFEPMLINLRGCVLIGQKEVESEMQQLLKEVRQHYEDRFKKNLITACASSLRQAELQQQKNNVNNKRKIRGLKNQVKHETEEEVVKVSKMWTRRHFHFC